MTQVELILKQVRGALTPDLLKREYREKNAKNPMYGHCYVATEAAFYILKGLGIETFPTRGRDGDGVCHWWLEDASGIIIDPTADQYFSVGKYPPYSNGKRGGFLTKTPSKRTAVVIKRVNQ